MGSYRIMIDRLDNVTDEPTVRVIECATNYTLQDDVTEWVREEVDPNATIIDVARATLIDIIDETDNGPRET